MTDEDKKRIVSEPPPPTDEIDGEWEGGDDEKTLIRDVPEGVSKSQPAPSSAAVSGTAVAPISTPPKAAAPTSTPPKATSTPPKAAEASTPPEMKAAAPVERDEEDEDEDEEEDEDDGEEETPVENEDDEDEEDEDEDDDAHDPAVAKPVAAPSADWLPEWAPYAVLAGLVGASIVFGLGLVGGSAAATEDEVQAEAPAASAAQKPLAKPSKHP